MRQSDNKLSFFKFIDIYFGLSVVKLLKQWDKCHRNIIKIRFQILILEKYYKFDIIPPHLRVLDNFNVNLFTSYSVSKFKKERMSMIRRIVKIEINDTHRRLHFLVTNSYKIRKDILSTLPNNICYSFFRTNNISLNRYYQQHYTLFKRKSGWLDSGISFCVRDNIKPINYYCTLNSRFTRSDPRPCRRLRSDSRAPEESFDRFSLSLTPVDNVSSINNSKISISPFSFHPPLDKNFLPTNKKWFTNLSSSHIPEDVIRILQLGDGFSLPISNKNKFVVEFVKQLESNLDKYSENEKSMIRSEALPIINKVITNINFNKTELSLLRLSSNTNKFLKNNNNILITKADKGNITVALHRNEYITRVEETLNDSSTYSIVPINPTNRVRCKLHDILKRWKTLGYISPSTYNFLNVTDSTLPRAYGLPKIHKPNNPFRIIVSSINTYLYPIASYLHDILSKSLPKPQSHIENGFHLIKKLSNTLIDDNFDLISLDVVSLFTNVSLDLAVSGIRRRWPDIKKQTPLPCEEFMTALSLIFDSTYFTFNNITYKQIFGTPMGSPLSPIIADIVIQDVELKSLNRLPFIPPFYVRYVDDIALAVPSSLKTLVLDTFNDIHPRLQFTIESSTNNTLNFLDVSLILQNNRLLFNWYKKPTFSGRYLHFLSNHPLSQKRGVVFGLVDRSIKLSDPQFHQENLTFIVNILLENGYPLDFIFNTINSRLITLITAHNTKVTKTTVDSESSQFFTLPFASSLFPNLKSFFKKFKFKPAYRSINKLQKFIKVHKDSLPPPLRNNIVYRIQCQNCDASYVGQSSRLLKTRLKEHQNHINRNTDQHSVITDHRLNQRHEFDWDDVTILDEERSYKKRLISEMINIRCQKNGLNLQSDTEFLCDSYLPVIDKILKF